jgi:hypothetical protein
MKTITALLICCVTAFGQGRDHPVGGVVLDSVTAEGIADVAVNVECEASGSYNVVTDAEGFWDVETLDLDYCVVDFTIPDYSLYQGGYYTLDPTCPIQRMPDNKIHLWTGNESDSALVTVAIPHGEQECRGCQGGGNSLEVCWTGDWNGDGTISILSDLPVLADCIIMGECDGVCYWAADADGSGFLSLADVQIFVDIVFFGAASIPCELVPCI